MTSLYMPQCLWRTGFSLIPVYGDKDLSQPKVAAVKWDMYQKHRATMDQVVSWFESGYQLAVVTGRVSGVVVFDFDDMTLWEAFRASALFPLASNNLTVRTRRGIHLYVPVATSGDTIGSRRRAGWDLLAEGKYAVAPHAIIGSHGYGIVMGDPAHMGAPNEPLVGLILAWLLAQGPDDPDETPDLDTGIEAGERLSIEGAKALYRTWSLSRGRNTALHLVAKLMHDHFYDIDVAIEALTDLHITARPPEGHCTETPEARRREALATIRSAYSKSRRAVRSVAVKQLPNVIREYMNQNGLTGAARLLDALRSKGIRPGSFLTRREIQSAVAGVVRSHSMRLGFEFLRGKPLPKTHPTTAISRSEVTDTNCICIGGQNRLISNRYKKGKEATLLYLPTDEQLAHTMGLTELTKASDPLTPEELKSVRRYRAALFREFIRRRSGTYGREMLAAKHGVHHRTLRRYAHAEQICSAPTIISTPLTSTAVQGLGFGAAETIEVYYNQAGRNRTRAVYLVDEDDNRYPALSVVAAKLIALGKKLTICQRLANYYWHQSQSERAPVIVLKQKPLPAPVGSKKTKKKTVSKSPIFPAKDLPVAAEENDAAFMGLFDRVVHLKEERKPRRWQRTLPAHSPRHYRKPLPHAAHEYVATMLHEKWPAIAIETARRVVHLRGGQEVYRAISIVDKRLQRGDVHDPAAYFLTVAGFSTAARKQKDEKKDYLYRVITPRRLSRYARKDTGQ